MRDDWVADFKRLCERTIRSSVEDRIRHGFTYEYKPVLDDAPWRSFDSMEKYRDWCDQNLPKYLGYGRSDEIDEAGFAAQIAIMARREIERRKQLLGQPEL